MLAGGAHVYLPERLEHLCVIVIRDSDARIRHFYGDRVAQAIRGQMNLAFFSKFHRVAEQVQQDLAQLVRVGFDDATGLDLDSEIETLRMNERLRNRSRLMDQLTNLDRT